MMGKNVLMIDIDLLEPSPFNTYEIGDTSDLEGNILNLGVISPLSVIGPNEEGKYQILAGERRYTAVKNINTSGRGHIQELFCHIMGPATMKERLQRLIIESSNIETREFDKNQHRFNVIRILKEMADEGEIEEKELAKKVGEYLKISDRYRTMYLQLFNNGDEELLALLDKDPEGKRNKVSISDAAKVSYMDKDVQKEIIEDIKEGVRPKDAIKAHAPSKKNKETSKETEVTKDELPVINDLETEENNDIDFNGDIDDLDLDSLTRQFEDMSPGLDLDVDTTGEFKALNVEDNNEQLKFLKRVSSWCNKMKKKEEYTEEELDVIENMKELIIHIEELSL